MSEKKDRYGYDQKKIPLLNLRESINCVLDKAREWGTDDKQTLIMLERFIKAIQNGTIPVHSQKIGLEVDPITHAMLKKGNTMKDEPEREITIDDIIFITKHMEGPEYLDFMNLSGEKRIEFTREKLKGIEGK